MELERDWGSCSSGARAVDGQQRQGSGRAQIDRMISVGTSMKGGGKREDKEGRKEERRTRTKGERRRGELEHI